ncbi:MAG: sugar phosphate isomerase/epimerase [Armatimonadetes bacterium]|nr:sugar phosphate isomerase/epimerase [Armatimonadota bacterium]
MLAARALAGLDSVLDQAHDAGFSLCQINFLWSGFTRNDLAAVANQMADRDMRPVGLGCYWNPMRPDDAGLMGVNQNDLRVLLQNLDVIGARRVVMWSGTYADTLLESDERNAGPECKAQLRDRLAEIVRGVRARHYYLVIEPWHTHVLDTEDACTGFYRTLPPDVAEHVRFVLDPPNLITPARYEKRDEAVSRIVRRMAQIAGVVHLKDCIMPPDGEAALPGPGEGKLNYPAFMNAVHEAVPGDIPAVIEHVAPDSYAIAREFVLRITNFMETV